MTLGVARPAAMAAAARRATIVVVLVAGARASFAREAAVFITLAASIAIPGTRAIGGLLVVPVARGRPPFHPRREASA